MQARGVNTMASRVCRALISVMSLGDAGCSIAHAQGTPSSSTGTDAAVARAGDGGTSAVATGPQPYLFVHPPTLQNNGYVPDLILRALHHHHDQIIECYR